MAKEEIISEIDTKTGETKSQVHVKEGQQQELQLENPDIHVEVIDDTPPQDRNKTAVKVTKQTEKEVEQYSESVKKRINELKYDFHTERRAKEAAARERDEALRVAKSAYEQLQEVKKKQAKEYEEYKKQLQEKAEIELKAAKAQFEKAYEAGDKSALADAQEAMSRATVNQEVAKRFTPPQQEVSQNNSVQQQDQQVQGQQQTKVVPPDSAATEWGKRNAWFGEDEEMTSFAFGVHEKLIKQGVDPVKGAEEYYKRIDARMREVFPDYDWGDEEVRKPQRKQESKSATVVAPVQRTNKGTKVTLTATQAQLAKRLGITPEQYARELLKEMERTNG